MSVETTTCYLIQCDGDDCGRYDEYHEYETPVHWQTVDDAIAELTTDRADDESRWSYDATTKTWLCPYCIARLACEADGGHQWSRWQGWDGERVFRYCERPGCETSEHRPVETGAPL